MRWALTCAALVTASGAVVLVLMLVMTQRLLRDGARDMLPPRPAAAQPAPGAAGGSPAQREAQRRVNQDQLDAGHTVTTHVIRQVRLIGLAALGGLALASVGIGWVVAGRMIRPLHRITAAAAAVSGARLGDRIDLDGPADELKEMADTFDAMLDRLDVSFAAQRTFVADASHELRTPLSVMRTVGEVALDNPEADVEELRAALGSNIEMLERTSDLVDRLLALSRADTLVAITDHDLSDSVLVSLATRASMGIDDAGVVLDLASAPVRGDPLLLDRLVANLLDNAATHNRVGGQIWITTSNDGASSRIVVENDGPAVEPDVVDRLFERFTRENHSATGTGVGLAIVAAVSRTHGGAITAQARPTGGLRVEISLP